MRRIRSPKDRIKQVKCWKVDIYNFRWSKHAREFSGLNSGVLW